MGEVGTIGLDRAKTVFQAHGADASAEWLFKRKLRRDALSVFFASQPRRLGAMEARASAHYWARPTSSPFVKRQKTDMADAEAITLPRGRRPHMAATRTGLDPSRTFELGVASEKRRRL